MIASILNPHRIRNFILRVLVIFFFVLTGMMVGLSIKDSNLIDKVRFWLRPVVVMRGELVEGPKDGYVIISMQGEKIRGVECEYRGLQAQGDKIVGSPVDLRSQQIDIPETMTTKDAGKYHIGSWRIWPVEGIYRIRVIIGHDCQGTKVATEIARVVIN